MKLPLKICLGISMLFALFMSLSSCSDNGSNGSYSEATELEGFWKRGELRKDAEWEQSYKFFRNKYTFTWVIDYFQICSTCPEAYTEEFNESGTFEIGKSFLTAEGVEANEITFMKDRGNCTRSGCPESMESYALLGKDLFIWPSSIERPFIYIPFRMAGSDDASELEGRWVNDVRTNRQLMDEYTFSGNKYQRQMISYDPGVYAEEDCPDNWVRGLCTTNWYENGAFTTGETFLNSSGIEVTEIDFIVDRINSNPEPDLRLQTYSIGNFLFSERELVFGDREGNLKFPNCGLCVYSYTD